jgi:hypothetical protein
MIKAFTVSILSLFFFSSVHIAFINENTEEYLEKNGTFEINSRHLYTNGDCPGKHGTNGNPKEQVFILMQNVFPVLLKYTSGTNPSNSKNDRSLCVNLSEIRLSSHTKPGDYCEFGKTSISFKRD